MRRYQTKQMLALCTGTALFFAAMSAHGKEIPQTEGDAPASVTPENALLFEAKVESSKDRAAITLVLDREVAAEKLRVEDHGSFLQILLPHVAVMSPGEFIDGPAPYVQKIASYQVNTDEAAVRIFAGKNAAFVKRALKLASIGSNIILEIDQVAVAKLVAEDPAVTAAPTGASQAEDVIAQTKVSNEISAPSNTIQVAEPKAVATLAKPKNLKFKQANNFTSKLYIAAAFCGIMIAGMLFIFFIRNMLRKKKGFNPGSAVNELRIVASQILSPKQRIQLIQVGGEQFLIGVSPENISFLTAVQNQTQRAIRATTMEPQTLEAAPTNATPAQIKAAEPEKRVGATTKKPSKAYSNFETMISDEGVTTYEKREAESKPAETIPDITKLIRQKLKDLPKI